MASSRTKLCRFLTTFLGKPSCVSSSTSLKTKKIQPYYSSPADDDASSTTQLLIDGDDHNCMLYESVAAKEYNDYRRSLYGGGITHKALLVDAVGTLVVPAQPTAQIYKQIGEKYGVDYSEAEILQRYRWAYAQPWDRSHLRYVDDGRPFWKKVVTYSTGCSNSQYFEEVYDYFMTGKAWKLCDPDTEIAFQAIRNAGVKVAVVSNFDTRLRPLLKALKCDHWFDAVAVSAEVNAEKPNPMIFLKACEVLGVNPEDAVHVGDDRRNDVWAARDAGCDAWLWGSDVHTFKEIAQRIVSKV